MNTVLPLVTLRPGHAGDVDGIVSLMARAFDPRFGEAWTRSQLTGILGMPGVWLILAEADGRIAGFALTRVILDEAELLLIATDPDRRRQGVGRTLLDRTIDTVRQRGGVRLHLEVRQGNGAVDLYRSAGFRKVGTRRDYYRGPGGTMYAAETLARMLD